MLRSLRETGGTAVAVSDEDLLDGMRELAEREGCFACPEGGATLAALRRLRDAGHPRRLVLADDWIFPRCLEVMVAVAESYRQSLRIKAPSVNVGVAQLSGGNQQKVVLGKWLFTEPDVLILDEPTRGIDVGAKYEIYTLIQQLAAAGKGVILISSELPELLGLADRIYTLCEGVITGVLDRAEANQERLMRLMTSAVAGYKGDVTPPPVTQSTTQNGGRP
jgi:ATPase subunit of ABC transporter with duplicated ATPase domains